MRVRAPGKLVLSGAYAVLEGAPAIVAAVDRYVIADTSLAAEIVTDEMREALGDKQPPHIDASALRAEGRKLGLGSSAAIVVAALGAVMAEEGTTDEELGEKVFPLALRAHRKEQGGGSGIDVLASALGGVRACWLECGTLGWGPFEIPRGITVGVLAAPESAVTSEMLVKVRDFAAREPAAYLRLMDALCEAAQDAAQSSAKSEYLNALWDQASLLQELGDNARAPIVPMSLRDVAKEARGDDVVVMPSGAGGGDIVLCVGEESAVQRHADALIERGYKRVEAAIGARGLHRF